MGWDELNSSRGPLATKSLAINDFGGGVWYNLLMKGIPGNILEANSKHASYFCQSVYYYDGRLNVFPDEVVLTSAGSGATHGIFYSPVMQTMVGARGTVLYKDLNLGAATVITGAVVINATQPISWVDWQFEATKLIIGTDGINPVFKWSGVGNAAILGGSPPLGKYVTVWQNSVWIANLTPTSKPSQVSFSNLGDAEVWDVDDSYSFDAPITGIATFGDQLVVFMDDHIGVMSGPNNRLLTKVDRWVENVGCSGHWSIARGKFQEKDVLIFQSYDGVYVYDGSRSVIKISPGLDLVYNNPFSGGVSYDVFTNLNFSYGVYLPRLGFYILINASNDTGAPSMRRMFFIDLKNPYEFQGKTVCPVWPKFYTPTSTVFSSLAIGKTSVSDPTDFVFFQTDTSVKEFNFFQQTDEQAGWLSQIYDLGDTIVLQEASLFGPKAADAFSLGVAVTSSAGVVVSDTLDGTTLQDFDWRTAKASPGSFGRYIGITINGSLFKTNAAPSYVERVAVVLTPLGQDPLLPNVAL